MSHKAISFDLSALKMIAVCLYQLFGSSFSNVVKELKL